MHSELLSEEHHSYCLMLALNAYCSHVLTRNPGISEKIEVKYGEILIGMPIFNDDIAAIGGAENRKRYHRENRRGSKGKAKETDKV